MVDKRVAFDFALQFSNGGGLQGQGFRLDIEGDTISDDELAAYIIRDLRLLMVGQVDILNKQIIEEQHKRTSKPENASLARPNTQIPGVVVRAVGIEHRAIEWTNFAAIDVSGRAVLVNTGWDRHWRTDRYFEDHPFLTEAAAAYLRDRGAALVGIDSLNIDDTTDPTRPVHSILLAAGIPIVEHLTNLSALPIDGFTFTAAPPKIVAMGTFPVRAHAILNTANVG